jgi:hypothetical protein
LAETTATSPSGDGRGEDKSQEDEKGEPQVAWHNAMKTAKEVDEKTREIKKIWKDSLQVAQASGRVAVEKIAIAGRLIHNFSVCLSVRLHTCMPPFVAFLTTAARSDRLCLTATTTVTPPPSLYVDSKRALEANFSSVSQTLSSVQMSPPSIAMPHIPWGFTAPSPLSPAGDISLQTFDITPSPPHQPPKSDDEPANGRVPKEGVEMTTAVVGGDHEREVGVTTDGQSVDHKGKKECLEEAEHRRGLVLLKKKEEALDREARGLLGIVCQDVCKEILRELVVEVEEERRERNLRALQDDEARQARVAREREEEERRTEVERKRQEEEEERKRREEEVAERRLRELEQERAEMEERETQEEAKSLVESLRKRQEEWAERERERERLREEEIEQQRQRLEALRKKAEQDWEIERQRMEALRKREEEDREAEKKLEVERSRTLAALQAENKRAWTEMERADKEAREQAETAKMAEMKRELDALSVQQREVERKKQAEAYMREQEEKERERERQRQKAMVEAEESRALLQVRYELQREEQRLKDTLRVSGGLVSVLRFV